MPWTEKQHRLFCAVAHGMKKKGLSKKKAKKMCSEGVKKVSKALVDKS